MNRWTRDAGSQTLDRDLTCTVECEYPVAVIHIDGWLDPGGVPDLRACVRDCLAAEPGVIVLEVADLSVAADECVAVFAVLSCQAMTWPGTTLVFACASRSWSVQELLEPAELVATELVANAVRHAGGRVVLTVSLRQGDLQISVGDDSPALPHRRVSMPSDEHGRGLLMVDALCKDWGMTCVGDGKVVWAKVAAAPG